MQPKEQTPGPGGPDEDMEPPAPPAWARAHRALLAHARTGACDPPDPPKPLILAAAAFTTPAERRVRWAETRAWADRNGGAHLLDGIAGA